MSGRLLWPELEPADQAAGFLPEIEPMTSSQVLAALAAKWSMDGFNGMPGRWVFVREVSATTGTYGGVQRFDALAIGLVPSVKYARVAFEVKVSRADWLREQRPIIEYRNRFGTSFRAHSKRKDVVPDGLPGEEVVEIAKWQAALDISNELWFAAPPRCILPDELPSTAGLLEIRLWGPDRQPRARVVRPAPWRDTPMPDRGWWAAVLRRAAERRGERAA